MDQICSGCNTKVAKPVTCASCGIASHPGCLYRCNHPSFKGKFLDCLLVNASQASQSSVSSINPPLLDAREVLLLDNVRQIFRQEMEDILSTKLEAYERRLIEYIDEAKSELKSEISSITSRVCELEERISFLSSASATPCTEEDIIAEIADRQQRLCNIMIFNVEESSNLINKENSLNTETSSVGNTTLDKQLVDSILKQIDPSGIPVRKVFRVGTNRSGRPRPLRVILSSREDVISILKNKWKYNGPARISEDYTKKQQTCLSNLRAELKRLHDSGDKNKTIRFVRGVPKIVNSVSQKN